MKYAFIFSVVKLILNIMGICNTTKGGKIQARVAGTIDTFGLIP
jgi:hypothetical protein